MNKEIVEGLFLLSVEEDERGGVFLDFEIKDPFRSNFLKTENLKRWSNQRFEKWVNDAILKGIKLIEEELSKKKEEVLK